MILKEGARPDIQDHIGNTALNNAQVNGYTEIENLLKQALDKLEK